MINLNKLYQYHGYPCLFQKLQHRQTVRDDKQTDKPNPSTLLNGVCWKVLKISSQSVIPQEKCITKIF